MRKYRVRTPDIRFWAKVDPCRTDGCAVWVAGHDAHGYGTIRVGAQIIKAHHFLLGKPPAGLTIDHLCRNRSCVWPEHLEAVTLVENIRRGGNTIKTHCIHGHPLDEANTYIYGAGKRQCRQCQLRNHAAYRARRNAAR